MAEISTLLEIFQDGKSAADLVVGLRSESARPGLERFVSILEAGIRGCRIWTRPQIDVAVAVAKLIVAATRSTSVVVVVEKTLEFCIRASEEFVLDDGDFGLQKRPSNKQQHHMLGVYRALLYSRTAVPSPNSISTRALPDQPDSSSLTNASLFVIGHSAPPCRAPAPELRDRRGSTAIASKITPQCQLALLESRYTSGCCTTPSSLSVSLHY